MVYYKRTPVFTESNKRPVNFFSKGVWKWIRVVRVGLKARWKKRKPPLQYHLSAVMEFPKSFSLRTLNPPPAETQYALTQDFVKAFSITNITYLLKFDKNDGRDPIFSRWSEASTKGNPPAERWSSPQQAAGYLERNCAEAQPAFALRSYSAVASPFLPAVPPKRDRVSWRRWMK